MLAIPQFEESSLLTPDKVRKFESNLARIFYRQEGESSERAWTVRILSTILVFPVAIAAIVDLGRLIGFYLGNKIEWIGKYFDGKSWSFIEKSSSFCKAVSEKVASFFQPTPKKELPSQGSETSSEAPKKAPVEAASTDKNFAPSAPPFEIKDHLVLKGVVLADGKKYDLKIRKWDDLGNEISLNKCGFSQETFQSIEQIAARSVFAAFTNPAYVKVNYERDTDACSAEGGSAKGECTPECRQGTRQIYDLLEAQKSAKMPQSDRDGVYTIPSDLPLGALDPKFKKQKKVRFSNKDQIRLIPGREKPIPSAPPFEETAASGQKKYVPPEFAAQKMNVPGENASFKEKQDFFNWFYQSASKSESPTRTSLSTSSGF